MRIVHFNAGGPEFKSREFQYDAHHAHMIDELRRRGHEVLHINPAAILGRFGTKAEYRDVTVTAVRRFQAEGGCDLFFATAVDHSFSPDTARDIANLGIPTVNLNMDDMSHPYRVREVTPAFDLVWTTDLTNMDLIRGYGARQLVHMPFGANPNMFHPVPGSGPEARAILFIGACYGARARAIARLAQADVPVHVYGRSPMEIYGRKARSLPAVRALLNYRDGWQRAWQGMKYPAGRACIGAALLRTAQNTLADLPEKHPERGSVQFHPGPSFADWSGIMAGTALSLGSLELASTFVLQRPLLFIRLREFEAAMCGAAHLASGSAELKGYFAEDREMIYYDSYDEMVDKAKFWLHPDRDTARTALRAAVHKTALGAHTWAHRFQKIVDILGIRGRI